MGALASTPPPCVAASKLPTHSAGYGAHCHQRVCWDPQQQSEILKALQHWWWTHYLSEGNFTCRSELQSKKRPGVLRSQSSRKALLTFLIRPLPAPPYSFWLVFFSLLRAASCWQATAAKLAPTEPFQFWLLASWCSSPDFTTRSSHTEHTEAARATPTVIFRTVMTRPCCSQKSHRRGWAELKAFGRCCGNWCLRIKEFCCFANAWQNYAFLHGFYKSIPKMLTEFTISQIGS